MTTDHRHNPLSTAQPAPKIAVVIPTVGRSSVRHTVESILNQQPPVDQLLVVVNKPETAEVVEILAGIQDSRLLVLAEPVRGASAARNCGIAHSDAEIIAFTDDDAIPAPGWIEQILDTFTADTGKHLGGMTGLIYGLSVDSAERQWFEQSGIFDKGETPAVFAYQDRPEWAHFGGLSDVPKFFLVTGGPIGTGLNMAFRRSTLVDIHGFDERLSPGLPTHGGEDLDIYRRTLDMGQGIAYNPKAMVGHHHRDTSDELRSQMYGYGTGMAAHLCKFATEHPANIARVARMIPQGISELRSHGEIDDNNSATTMTAEHESISKTMRAVELFGLLTGPLHYARTFVTMPDHRFDLSRVIRPEDNIPELSSEAPSISVIICAYTMRRWDDIIAAIESAVGQLYRPHDIIVVADHNESLREALDEEVASRRWETVAVVANTDTQGLSGARNTGVEAATGDIVAFLDDDAVAAPDWTARIANRMLDPTVLGVGGHAEPVWPEHRPTWMPDEFFWVVGCSYTGQPQQPSPVRNPIGCNMAMRRVDVLEVGGFTDGIGRIGTTPLGCEETELSIRLSQLRSESSILYDPAVRVRHRVTQDRTTWAYFRRRCWAEGMSKAVVSELVGAESALSSERAYSMHVLPMGVAKRVLRATVNHRLLDSTRPAALAQAGAIIAGFGVTASGYLRAKVATQIRK